MNTTQENERKLKEFKKKHGRRFKGKPVYEDLTPIKERLRTKLEKRSKDLLRGKSLEEIRKMYENKKVEEIKGVLESWNNEPILERIEEDEEKE